METPSKKPQEMVSLFSAQMDESETVNKFGDISAQVLPFHLSRGKLQACLQGGLSFDMQFTIKLTIHSSFYTMEQQVPFEMQLHCIASMHMARL